MRMLESRYRIEKGGEGRTKERKRNDNMGTERLFTRDSSTGGLESGGDDVRSRGCDKGADGYEGRTSVGNREAMRKCLFRREQRRTFLRFFSHRRDLVVQDLLDRLFVKEQGEDEDDYDEEENRRQHVLWKHRTNTKRVSLFSGGLISPIVVSF